MNQVATLPKRSLVDSMAAKYEMEPQAFMAAVKATCIKGECSNEQFAAFLMVAKEYDLNPLTKEIYAFPDRGGITPIVSVDGWMNLINSHPMFDGMEFVDNMGEDGKLYSVECKMYRKDRNRPTTVLEYMSECFRQTDPWKKWPNRMLRHKSAIQCARYAFGFSGIMEPDEYERMKDVTPPPSQPSVMERLKAAQNATQRPAGELEGFNASFTHVETSDALTGEILEPSVSGVSSSQAQPEQPDDASSTSSDTAADGASPQSSAPPAAPIPEVDLPKLRAYAKDVLHRAADKNTSAEMFKKIEARWAEDISKLSDGGKLAARSIANSCRSIMRGDVSLNPALEFHAEGLLCEPSELGA